MVLTEASAGRRKIAVHSAIPAMGCLLAVGSAVLHLIAMMSHDSAVVVTGTTAMAVACLGCARELWRRNDVRAWTLAAMMNIAMIGLHLPLAGGHHHTAPVPTVVPPDGVSAMSMATALALAEVGFAAAVLWWRTRGYSDRLVASASDSSSSRAIARSSLVR